MVDGQVRTNKVIDHALIRAFRNIPREIFVDAAQAEIAYVDAELPLAGGRFLLAPMTLARLLQLAEITQSDRVLDCGSATGYSTAIIASLCLSVVGIDADADCVNRADAAHKNLSIANSNFATAMPLRGHAAKSPFDVIIVNGAVSEMPQHLCGQLADGGRLLCILREWSDVSVALGLGKAMIYEKKSGTVSGRVLFDATAPYLENPVIRNKFVF